MDHGDDGDDDGDGSGGGGGGGPTEAVNGDALSKAVVAAAEAARVDALCDAPRLAIPRPRRKSGRCRKCYAPLQGDGVGVGALCAECVGQDDGQAAVMTASSSTAVEDRKKRLKHRATHTRAGRILVNDLQLRGAKYTSFGLSTDGAEAAAAAEEATRKDVRKIADATIGCNTRENNIAMDHVIDSYFAIATVGKSRMINDRTSGAKVSVIPASILAPFYTQFIAEVCSALLVVFFALIAGARATVHGLYDGTPRDAAGWLLPRLSA